VRLDLPVDGAGMTSGAPGNTALEATEALIGADTVDILLVDDKVDKLTALEAVLADRNVNIVKAQSGMEALRLLLKQDFAVVLLDVHMPVMDGFETASLIRQRPRSEHTPIIFMTAVNAGEAHVSRGYALGAVDYIFAPVEPEVIRAKTAVFIDLFRKTEQVRRQSEWLRSEAERRAALLETRLKRLLNRLDVGVFRTTLEGTLVEANPAFLNLLGLSSIEAAATADLHELHIPPRERPLVLRKHGEDGRVRERDVHLRRADGTWIWCALSRTVSVAEDGATYVDGLLEDITDHKLAQEALEQQAQELARSNADLQQFAFVASHDLQEPLRMVASFTDLLARRYRGRLDETADEYIAFAVDGAKRMQRLIHDLLAYSRIGTHSKPFEPCDTGALFDRAVRDLDLAIRESGAEVARGELPTVPGDLTQLAQVFQNLIGNAVKFRSDQPPRVRVDAEMRDDAWLFSVRDNGIGVEPRFADRVFEIFQRLHGHDEYTGTGIGLAICKRIVERHGGRIWVESTPGEGSVFRFTIATR
jgi:PAS domain S-box-containing protein